MSAASVAVVCRGATLPHCVEIRPPLTGLFAILNFVAISLNKLEHGLVRFAGGVEAVVDERSNYFEAAFGPNAWLYYFEPIRFGKEDGDPATTALAAAPRVSVDGWETVMRGHTLSWHLLDDRTTMARLAAQYIRPRSVVLAAVDFFERQLLVPHQYRVVGVHYRGTDKATETPRVAYESVLNAARRAAAGLVGVPAKATDKPVRYFVATDEAPFLAWLMSKVVGNETVVAVPGVNRSSDTTTPNQYRQASPYQSGRFALLDCLLLARCHALVRTPSNLSRWSTFFNPRLPVTYVVS